MIFIWNYINYPVLLEYRGLTNKNVKYMLQNKDCICIEWLWQILQMLLCHCDQTDSWTRQVITISDSLVLDDDLLTHHFWLSKSLIWCFKKYYSSSLIPLDFLDPLHLNFHLISANKSYKPCVHWYSTGLVTSVASCSSLTFGWL